MKTPTVCADCGGQLSIHAGAPQCSRCMLRLGLEPAEPGSADDWAAGIPASIGEYQVLGAIARGGMGMVLRARQPRIERTVALKLIRAELLASPGARTRFRVEVQAAGLLRHPNIVTVFEANEHDGQEFFSMELIEGQSLDRLIETEGPLKARRAARMLAEIADAVDHAHSRGILHRDLKPGNVLIDENDRPRVTDFGIALRAAELIPGENGLVAGTPAYMAPEQLTGRYDDVSSATDVYGLGAILYEMLTGHPPYRAGSPDQLLIRVLDGPPERPRRLERSIPRDLEAICLRCLAHRPDDRYASAADLAADLRAFGSGEPMRAARGGRPGAALRWLFQRPALALTYAALALFLAEHWTVHLLGAGGLMQSASSDIGFHRLINLLIPGWALLATGLQLAVESTDRKTLVRYVWSTLDVVLLTIVLLNADGTWALETLLPLYLIIIVATGFRWRTGLAIYTTIVCILATLLVYANARSTGAAAFASAEHLFIPITSMIVVGIIAAALVKRMRVLAGFGDAR